MLTWITDKNHLAQITTEHSEFLVLAFLGSFSETAQRATSELTELSKDYKELPLFAVDVQKAKGLHKDYGVTSVPTVLVVKNGKEANRFEGLESASYYATHLLGMAPSRFARPTKKKPLRVTVYTSPGCAPCGLVKNYLREHKIPFHAIDISADQRAAREIVRRSGQQAVPQIDINGRIVVGFDRNKLANLLGIGQGRERIQP